MSFLILDGMLGWPAKLYDASWIEWGQMASSAKGGALSDDSPWRTDTPARSEAVTYTADSTLGPTAVDPVLGADSKALRADMVNVTDAAACGSGGGGRPIAPGY